MRSDELRLILEEGEGYRIEFKEGLSNLDREMTAFANSGGGRVFLGITDDKQVKGIRITNRLKSEIQDTARNCDPPVKVLFDVSGSVLIVNVREGTDKPYRCASGFYTRVGPSSQKMRRDEIVEFFRTEGKIRWDDLINLKFDYRKHFDPRKLDRFLHLAGISRVTNIPAILVNLGVAEKQEGKVIFNNAGILFFARHLDDVYRHTAVTCALYKGREKVDVLDRKDYNEDIVSNVDLTMNFLKQYIPVRYEMTGEPQRREIPEIPFEALREAVINAVCHRDYFERGSNVMVEMFDDRIEITSFGGLPRGMKPSDLGKKSVLRNPTLAGLLNRIHYIEKMGTGIRKIRLALRSAHVPQVRFECTGFFTAVFPRPGAARRTVADEAGGAISGATNGAVFGAVFGAVKPSTLHRVMRILGALRETGMTNAIVLQEQIGIPRRTLQRDLARLVKYQLVEFQGAAKTGAYVLTAKGKSLLTRTEPVNQT